MAGLCEGGNEPPGSLKAICKKGRYIAVNSVATDGNTLPCSTDGSHEEIALTPCTRREGEIAGLFEGDNEPPGSFKAVCIVLKRKSGRSPEAKFPSGIFATIRRQAMLHVVVPRYLISTMTPAPGLADGNLDSESVEKRLISSRCTGRSSLHA
ncbi:hypothetical protein ANN_27487 [Periplaneta americana]|uniref:Uncharacterized protein n=1 Tax=Periplaneta americana TaxID=6978 RepID=A0ABQ8RVW3_PERAM|nr:hypothetical protein ANN_27487 [Periplaneta americana]